MKQSGRRAEDREAERFIVFVTERDESGAPFLH